MKIFVIIVTYNGEKWIEKCITSLINSSIQLEIIVLDNLSTDNTINIIEDNFSYITLIKFKKNIGFGKANNVGLKKAQREGADYVFLLNQDAWVMPDTIEKLYKQMQLHPGYGILSPIHLNGTETELDLNFSMYINPQSCPYLISDYIVSGKPRDEIYSVRFINAALWLISKECLEKIGGFCPLFPHYGEDVDYVFRLSYHKLKIGISPYARGVHDRPQGTSKINKYQREKQHYASILVTLCNINYSFFHCSINSIQIVFKAMIKQEITLIYIKYWIKLLCIIPQIIKHRKIAKRNDAIYIT